MGAIRLEDLPETKNRITRVAAKKKGGEVELKNKRGKIAVLNPDLCIGCGVCVYKCPTNSLVLERKEVIQHPPMNPRELTKIAVADFKAGSAKLGKNVEVRGLSNNVTK